LIKVTEKERKKAGGRGGQPQAEGVLEDSGWAQSGQAGRHTVDPENICFHHLQQKNENQGPERGSKSPKVT
jgi:hypothetical protein